MSSRCVEPSEVSGRHALSPLVAKVLQDAGHDAIHVREIDLHRAPDSAVFDRAAQEGRTVVSADTDFGTLLALRGARGPSVVLLRHGVERRPALQARLLLANLVGLERSLEDGCIVVLEPTRSRIRMLPLGGDD